LTVRLVQECDEPSSSVVWLPLSLDMGPFTVHAPRTLVASIVFAVSPSLGNAQPAREAELWSSPPDLAALDIRNGPGGPELAPQSGDTFAYLERDTKGASPGWKVAAADGLRWDVKQGVEAQAEVAVSRLLWILGYHQPPMYYVPSWTLAGGPTPGAQPGGRFRPELPAVKRVGRWSWKDNPFLDASSFRRLKVAMRLVNNWDLLDENTAIHIVEGPSGSSQRRYVVIDLGGSLGKGAWIPRRSTKNDVEDFERQEFVAAVDREGFVKFEDVGRRHRDLFQDIRVEDVRWVCGRLDRLTEEQWRELFKAAGYDATTSSRFVAALRRRIGDGLRLASNAPR
jgi:hypothetical protein